jgi:hypothetical protein
VRSVNVFEDGYEYDPLLFRRDAHVGYYDGEV